MYHRVVGLLLLLDLISPTAQHTLFVTGYASSRIDCRNVKALIRTVAECKYKRKSVAVNFVNKSLVVEQNCSFHNSERDEERKIVLKKMNLTGPSCNGTFVNIDFSFKKVYFTISCQNDGHHGGAVEVMQVDKENRTMKNILEFFKILRAIKSSHRAIESDDRTKPTRYRIISYEVNEEQMIREKTELFWKYVVIIGALLAAFSIVVVTIFNWVHCLITDRHRSSSQEEKTSSAIMKVYKKRPLILTDMKKSSDPKGNEPIYEEEAPYPPSTQ